MATSTPVAPAGMSLVGLPPNSRIVGIANYSTTFVVATETGIWRYSATDGLLLPVQFAVAPATKLL